MSGETGKDESGWTTDTLKEYVDTLRAADQAALAAALLSTEKAITKKEAADEKRFEAVNEFRQTLSDQATLFLPRTEYDTAHTSLVERVDDLRDRINRSEGKGQGTASFAGWAVAAVSLLITIIVAANTVYR